MFLAPTAREILRTPPLTGFLSWPMVVAASTINPVYEEGLWLGYVWNGPADGCPVAAVCVSIVLRTAVHAQQGWPALLGILPIGIAFSLYYARTRRLAPIIMAHALFDFVGLASLGRI
jgi:membrane protease YdiL (CAAX protease family)